MSSSSQAGCVVIVAGRHRALVDKAAALFAESGFDVISCKSVYGAVAELALKEQSRQVIVVGSLMELGREGGKFFQICHRHVGTDCLCLIEGRSPERSAVLTIAARSGALVIGSVAELEEVFEGLLKGLRNANKFGMNAGDYQKNFKKSNGVIKLSKAELEALLECR